MRRRDPRDHAREEVGYHVTARTSRRLQGRWAVKDGEGGNLLGTCLRLQTASEGGCCGSKDTKHKQNIQQGKGPGTSSLFRSCPRQERQFTSKPPPSFLPHRSTYGPVSCFWQIYSGLGWLVCMTFASFNTCTVLNALSGARHSVGSTQPFIPGVCPAHSPSAAFGRKHAGHWEVPFPLPRDLARQHPAPMGLSLGQSVAPLGHGANKPFALPASVLAQGWLHLHSCSCTARGYLRSRGRRTDAGLHAAPQAQPGKVREDSPGCRDREGGCCDRVDPAGSLRLGFVFPRWMNSAASQLPVHAGPSGNGSERPSQRRKGPNTRKASCGDHMEQTWPLGGVFQSCL